MAEKTRITVDFSPEAYTALCNVSDMLECSKAEVIRKALGLIQFVLKEQREGSKVVVKNWRGKTKEIVRL